MTDIGAPHTTSYDLGVVGQIKVYSGKYVKPYRMTPAMLDINDIAHALSRICRFGGHCAGFLSVAEHSVAVSRIVPPHLALAGLLHDAGEAYLGDMCRPLKKLPEMQVYRDAEERCDQAIKEKWMVAIDHPKVRVADDARLTYEIENRRNSIEHVVWPNEAKEMFLARFRELTGE